MNILAFTLTLTHARTHTHIQRHSHIFTYACSRTLVLAPTFTQKTESLKLSLILVKVRIGTDK